jgi:hypothetical protein
LMKSFLKNLAGDKNKKEEKKEMLVILVGL